MYYIRTFTMEQETKKKRANSKDELLDTKPKKKKDPSEKKKPKKETSTVPKKRITKTLLRAKYDVNSTNLDFDQVTGKPLEDVILEHFQKMNRGEQRDHDARDEKFDPGSAYTIRQKSKDFLKSSFYQETKDGFHEPLSPEISNAIYVLENELFYRFFAFNYDEYFHRVKELSVCLSQHTEQLLKDPTYIATASLEELFPKLRLKSTVLDDFDSFLKEQFFKGERDIVCKNKKCRSSNVTYKEIQMRGGDEPPTIFITCAICGTEERG